MYVDDGLKILTLTQIHQSHTELLMGNLLFDLEISMIKSRLMK